MGNGAHHGQVKIFLMEINPKTALAQVAPFQNPVAVIKDGSAVGNLHVDNAAGFCHADDFADGKKQVGGILDMLQHRKGVRVINAVTGQRDCPSFQRQKIRVPAVRHMFAGQFQLRGADVYAIALRTGLGGHLQNAPHAAAIIEHFERKRMGNGFKRAFEVRVPQMNALSVETGQLFGSGFALRPLKFLVRHYRVQRVFLGFLLPSERVFKVLQFSGHKGCFPWKNLC